ERASPVQASRVHEVRGARDGRAVRRHLALRRDLLLEDRQHARLLPRRLGRARRVPAPLLVPRQGGGQASRRDACAGDPGAGVIGANRNGAPVQAGAPVLLASEGRAITPAAVELAARLAREAGGGVHVFSVARVWGTSSR